MSMFGSQGPTRGPQGPARAQNGKCIKRAQIGVHGLKIGRIGVIFQCASFLFSKKPKKYKKTQKYAKYIKICLNNIIFDIFNIS